MIKIANNLKQLVKFAEENDYSTLGLGIGAGALGAAGVLGAKGVYDRYGRPLQDLGRPTHGDPAYTASAEPIRPTTDFYHPLRKAHREAHDAWHKLLAQMNREKQMRGKVDPATLQKYRAAYDEFKRLNSQMDLLIEHGITHVPETAPTTPAVGMESKTPTNPEHIRIDGADLAGAPAPAQQGRIRIDGADLAGAPAPAPKPQIDIPAAGRNPAAPHVNTPKPKPDTFSPLSRGTFRKLR